MSAVSSESGVDIDFHSIVIRQLDSARKSGGIFFDDIQSDIQTGLEDVFTTGSIQPKQCALYQNYPNPFNPSSTIGFYLPVSGRARVTVYNLIGEKVAGLLDENLMSGYHEIRWHAGNMASGVYIYTLEFNGMKQSKKLILLR